MTINLFIKKKALERYVFSNNANLYALTKTISFTLKSNQVSIHDL